MNRRNSLHSFLLVPWLFGLAGAEVPPAPPAPVPPAAHHAPVPVPGAGAVASPGAAAAGPATTSAASSPATTPTTALGDPNVPAKPPEIPLPGLHAPDIAPRHEGGPSIPVPEVDEIDWGAGADPDDDPDAVYTRLLGRVIDSVTKEPIGDVQVSFPELDLRALSSEDGMFMIHGIEVRADPYEVLLEAPNYKAAFESLAFPQKERGVRELELVPMGW